MATLNKISFLQIAGGRQLRKEVDALIQSYAADKVITTLSAPELPSNAYLLTGDEGISRVADTANQKSSSIYLSDVIDVSDWGDENALSFTIGDGTNQATVKLTKADIVDNRQTLYDLASAISNAKTTSGEALNLTASYDATNDAFSIYNKTGGESNKITIGVGDGKAMALINSLNMQQVNQSATEGGVASSLGTKMEFGSATYTAAAQDLSDKQAAYDAAKAAFEAAKAAKAELEANQDYKYSQDADAWIATYGSYTREQKKTYAREPWIADAVSAYAIVDKVESSARDQWYYDLDTTNSSRTPTIYQIKNAADAKLSAVDEDGNTFFDKLAAAQSAYDTANAAYTTAQNDLSAAQETYDNASTLSVSGTSENVITYTANDLLVRLKNRISALTEGSGTTLASLQAEVDALQAKSIKDVVKVPVTITYTAGDPATYGVTLPNDIDTLVPAMDTTTAIPVYNLDNTPVLNASGDQLTISVTGVTNNDVTTYTGVVNGVPSTLDSTKKVETYVPVTTDISGKVFATGTFTLDTLPENYLLDNNELAAISYQQAINEIIVRLAGTDEAIDAIADKVGNQAVQNAIDAAVAALRQTVSENKAEAKQDNAAVIAALETELAADKAALTEQVEVFNLTSAAQTTFVLTNTPNAAKITVKINGAVYEEDTGVFTVNRVSKTVTWTATEAEGGFDLTTDVANKIVIRYYTGDGSTQVNVQS